MQIPHITSKVQFESLLNETIKDTEEFKLRFPEILMYENIYMQLIALKSLLIEQKLDLDQEYIDEKFTIGAIATKNFDYEYEIYAQKLIRIFGASLRYKELS